MTLPPFKKIALNSAAIVAVAILSGCTFTPAPVSRCVPSFDGTNQNSGAFAVVDGGFIVTPHFRDRFAELVLVYGHMFDVPPDVTKITRTPDGTFFCPAQQMGEMAKMCRVKAMEKPQP